MNWNKAGRATLATVVSAALGLGATACSRDYTVAFVYATASTTTTCGVVDGYQVDYQSGALTQLANSPTQSGGKNPVTVVAAPSGKFIYVVHRDDSSVVEFAVGTDGKLYPQHTYNTLGSFPLAAAVDSTGSYLYVVSTYQPGFTDALPGPGNITVFPITNDGSSNDGSLGTATSVNVGRNPIGITVSPYKTGATTNYIYVADRETVNGLTGPSPEGVVLTFSHDSSGAALTPVTAGSSLLNGVPAGVQPSAIAVDPTARFVYVTDSLSNQLIGYVISNTGTPAAMVNGPFATGGFPINLTIDPRAKYLYVVNFNDATVSPYVIDQGSGTPVASTGSSSNAVKTNPTCVTIEPALGIYLYTSNNADQTVSGLQLSPNNGSLETIQSTPFPASALPSCLVAVANGAHATQVVNLQ